MGSTGNKTWKTFICYRRGDGASRKAIRYSRQMAEILYDCIRDDDSLRPVLFEERYTAGNLSFEEPGIREVMPDVAVFIPVITPDFFDDIISESYKVFSEPVEENYEEFPVYLKEIAHAVSRMCQICPIYIADEDGESFDRNQGKKESVTRMLTIIVRYLAEKYDFPYNPDTYKSFIEHFFSLVNPLTVTTADVDLMRNGEQHEKEERIARFRDSFSEWVNTSRDDEPSPRDVFAGNLLEHLVKIHTTVQYNGINLIFRNNIMDTNAYERLSLSRDPNYYCISSAYILGVESLKQKYSAESGKGRGFEDIRNNCFGAQHDNDYHYWPVGLSSDRTKGENPAFFSVCAICFGAIMLNNWYQYDNLECIRIGNRPSETELSNVRKNTAKAINLLLSLRDYENMSWVSTWDFGQKVGAVDGTINQTTLSISALLACGFLDAESVDSDPNKLISRIRVINNSLKWLKSKRSTFFLNGLVTYYWGDGCSDRMNLSLTLFCLDVFMKYYDKIQKATPVIRRAEKPEIDEMDFSTYCGDIKNHINGIILYMNHQLPEIISGAKTDYDKLLICSKVLKSYSGYISFENQNRKHPQKHTSDALDQAVRISREALAFLYEKRALVQSFSRENCENLVEIFPHITYEGKRAEGCDEYDNCAELLVIDAMIKGAELGLYDPDRLRYEDLLTGIEEAITLFQNVRILNETDTYITITGHNDLMSPIYAYYYYRMVIYDYLKLIRGKENGNR